MLQPFSRRSRFLLSSWLSLWGKDSIQSFSFTFSLTLPNLEQSIFVCCCRTERLNLFKLQGQAKVGGTLICVAGAVLMVLFRGPALFGETEAESLGHGESRHTETSGHFMSGFFNGLGRWNLGVLCLIGNCTCMAAFLAIQACHFLLDDPHTFSFRYLLVFGLTLHLKHIWSGSGLKEVSGESFSHSILVFLWDHVYGDICFFHD